MPTYQYRCTDCGNELEVVQKFTDAALVECPECAGTLRKIYNAVGVVFKGSGFYRTDSRAAASNGASSGETTSATKSEGGSSAEGNGSSTSSKPATAGAKAGGGESGNSAKSSPKVTAGSGSSTGN